MSITDLIKLDIPQFLLLLNLTKLTKMKDKMMIPQQLSRGNYSKIVIFMVIFLSVFVLYSMNSSYEFSSDTRATTSQANWLAHGNGLSLNGHPAYPDNLNEFGYWGVKLDNGKIVSIYPIAVSVTAAPFYYIATKLGFSDSVSYEGKVAKYISSGFLSAAIAMLYFAMRKRFDNKTTFVSIILLATGTMLYGKVSQALWNQSVAIFLHSLSFVLISGIIFSDSTSEKDNSSNTLTQHTLVFLSGIIAVWGGACRPSFFLWSILLFVILAIKAPKTLFAFAVGSLIAYAAHLKLNLLTYGMSEGLYVGKIKGVETNKSLLQILKNFSALLFSPSRGLFIYSPWLLLSVAGFAIALYKHRLSKTMLVILLIALFPAGILASLAIFGQWWGGWSNGPRLQSDALICMTLLSGYAFEPILKRWYSIGLIIPLFVYSGIVQYKMANSQSYYWEKYTEMSDKKILQRIWDWKTGNIAWVLSDGAITREILGVTEQPIFPNESIIFPISNSNCLPYISCGLEKSEPNANFLQMVNRKAIMLFHPQTTNEGSYRITIEGYDSMEWGHLRKVNILINKVSVGTLKRITASSPTVVSFNIPPGVIKQDSINTLEFNDINPPAEGLGSNYMRFTKIHILPETPQHTSPPLELTVANQKLNPNGGLDTDVTADSEKLILTSKKPQFASFFLSLPAGFQPNAYRYLQVYCKVEKSIQFDSCIYWSTNEIPASEQTRINGKIEDSGNGNFKVLFDLYSHPNWVSLSTVQNIRFDLYSSKDQIPSNVFVSKVIFNN